ncbi:MAG: hypothetical protein OXP75_11370 [Rhodospirillales bacterium]|nr:hypothetical protein [Rhodospirillales bacterium]
MFEKRSVPAPHRFITGQSPLRLLAARAHSRHEFLSSRSPPARFLAAPPGALHPADNPLDRMHAERVRPKDGPAAPGGLPVRASADRSRGVRECLQRFARTVLIALPFACAALVWNGGARADSLIWSATLVVQDTTYGSKGCNNEIRRDCSDPAVLSDDDFTYDGRNYRFNALYVTHDDFLHMLLTTVMTCATRDLTLHVGDRAFPIRNSTCRQLAEFWYPSLIQWRLNEGVSLSLTTSADSDPGTGLPIISVRDSGAEEGTDGTVDFEVTMSRANTETVTVNYGTSSGTAQAGADYVAAAGTLTFAPGETEKTVQVTLLDDAVDEGRETFRLKLSEAWGAVIADGDATVWVSNGDPVQGAWLGRFGRTVASQIVDAVSARLLDRPRYSQVTLGGRSANLARSDGEAGDSPHGWETDPARTGHDAEGYPRGMWPEPREGVRSFSTQTMTGRDLLRGSSFHLATGDGEDGNGFAAWGRVATSGFDGSQTAGNGELGVDGEVTTGTVGADVAWSRWLGGVALSVSEGSGRFDQATVDSGTLGSRLTTVSPYLRFELSERSALWGLVGYGTGEMTISPNDGAARKVRTDLDMRLVAGGVRSVLLDPAETDGLDLALKADAFLMRTDAAAAPDTAATQAEASRLRFLLEGARTFALGDGGRTLTPSLELGLRQDGGDGETGIGVEAGGGLRFADPGSGLSVETRGRMLLAHEASGMGEWDASAAVRLDPGRQGRGLSLYVTPSVGGAPGGEVGLWALRDPDGLPRGSGEAGTQLQAGAEYGFRAPAGRGLLTPHAGFSFAGSSRTWHTGLRWRLAEDAVMGIEGIRSEPAGGLAVHSILLRAATRW